MKLIIDIDDKEYELINKTGITLDLNTAFHGKEKDKEMTFAIFNLVKALKNGTPYNPQGDLISREALLKRVDEERKYLIARGQTGAEHILVHNFRDLIDNAPTVEAYPFEQVQELVKLNQQFAQEIENLKRAQGELIRLDLAKRVIAKFAGYLDDDMIARIQIALEKENEAEMKGDTE